MWAVRDRLTDEELALKVLRQDADDGELTALVREAVSLSALEGLGVPRVLAFGQLPDGRRYLLRELVRGMSLDEVIEVGGAWLEPLVRAGEQLTVLHRAGLFHGDIKPANIICTDEGAGTLVDLGLAAPWKEGGARPRGTTPRFAAPEILQGERLTVRAEVYSLGATLAYALERRASTETKALAAVASRAMSVEPSARYPSSDEFTVSLRTAAGLLPSHAPPAVAWPILGLEHAADAILRAIDKLGPSALLAVRGPSGSGRSTLLRRATWSLGADGHPVMGVDARHARQAVDLERELSWWTEERRRELVIVVDDAERLSAAERATLESARVRGARLVVVGDAAFTTEAEQVYEVEPLSIEHARELLLRSVPSVPERIRDYILERLGALPGPLRAFVERLGTQAVVSQEDVDALLARRRPSMAPGGSPEEQLTELERLLDTGRFEDATHVAGALVTRPATDRVRLEIARARLLLGQGDVDGSARALEAVASDAAGSPRAREWIVQRARVFLRHGDYVAAERAAVVADGEPDSIGAEALSVRGVALSYVGDDAGARAVLEKAVQVAKEAGSPRASGIALGSFAIAHGRAGRNQEARALHLAALDAAESANDASTLTATRLNLAALAYGEGDLAEALAHLEAAVDLGRRAGHAIAVNQALLNLASLDLYLGRHARAEASVEALKAERSRLSAQADAQCTGLEAALARETGDVKRAWSLYETCAAAWERLARPLDAAEYRLECLFHRIRLGAEDPRSWEDALAQSEKALGADGWGEHGALAALVLGLIRARKGDEKGAGASFDHAIAQSQSAGQREWTWRALEARAQLAKQQGAFASARRDTEGALAILEGIAAKLPPDLREVFWNNAERRALRQASVSTFMAGPVTSGLTVGSNAMPAEDRLSRILEITRELASEHDMPRLLGRVTDHAVALLGAERGFVVLLGRQGELEVHVARDQRGEEAHVTFSRSVAEKVVTTGEPVIATSARDDVALAEAVSVHQLMIQSIACVPIHGPPPARRTIGALYVETRLRPGSRFTRELPTLLAFADQAAIAIENARLLAENSARADELARANLELSRARDRLSELLGRRTEQLAVTRRNLRAARAELRSHFGYAGLVGTSEAMRKLYAAIERIKDADVPVLITGESGTGKEMVAKAIHSSGERAKAPFVGLNCGAIPANLLESELFGHVRGAFTGADRDRKGMFREAERGTILLDEIGEMPVKMQAGLLRVLQEKLVRPVGGAHEEEVHARVLAATNRDLPTMVKEGTFREDLLYRLDVVHLRVPPLRERSEDIPLLVDHLLGIFAARYRRDRKTLSREALRLLASYDWPGNVRQLEHVLLNAWLMSEGDDIHRDDLSIVGARQDARRDSQPPVRSKVDYKDTERQRIVQALTSCNWNRVQAAQALGIPRRTFYRRLKEYGLL